MLKLSKVSIISVAALALSFGKTVAMEPTAKLTVVVDSLSSKQGEVCMRIYGRDSLVTESR